jgi:hypothetical protein
VAISNSIRAYNAFVLLVDSAPDVSGAEAGVTSMAITPNGAIYIKTGKGDFDWTLFASAGADTPVVEYRTLTLGESLSKSLILSETPTDSELVQLDCISGGPQNYATDYIVVGNVLSWNGLNLDGILNSGDKLRISYYK